MVDLDGVERIVALSPLGAGSGGLLVSFGLDKAQVFAEIQRNARRGIFLIVMSSTLVLVLASLGARRFIHRPLGQLVDAANEWRLGEFSRRVNIRGKSEIARAAGAFNAMADALEHRERELSEAKEKAEEAAARITMIFESTTDSVLMVDRNWCISYVNGPAWTQLAKRRNLIGANLLEAFPVAVEFEILSQVREAMSEQRPAFVEVFCTRRNFWYAINAFPLASVSQSSSETSPTTSKPWRRVASSRSSSIRARRWSRSASLLVASRTTSTTCSQSSQRTSNSSRTPRILAKSGRSLRPLGGPLIGGQS
jgi:HAMP domain-containing protein